MTAELVKKKRKPRHRQLKKEQVVDQQEAINGEQSPIVLPTEDITRSEKAIKKPTPYLDKYTENLTEKVRNNLQKYKIFGRDDEITECIISLNRETKNSPSLSGDAGVGKTAIVEGLVERILQDKVPERLKGVTVRALELSAISADTNGEDMVSKFKAIIEELKANRLTELLFIDEVHTIFGAGGKGSELNIGEALKPALSRGEIQIISATTPDEYARSIERDPALDRRFHRVSVEEPSSEQVNLILHGIGPRFEQKQGVKIEESAYEAAIALSIRYITEFYLPDKAIDLLDLATSRANVEGRRSITDVEIAREIEQMKGIPVTSILKSDYDRLLNLEEELSKRVKGQQRAVESVARAVYRSKEGLNRPKRPIGSFLFLGPTGVGKTELSKSLAELLFGDERALIRIDCSEYSSKGDKEKLIGKNEYGSQGILTEAVKRQPYSVVLFDELDKGDSDIFDIMLQILDEGHVTTGLGRKVDFTNTIIIGTTNMGAAEIKSTYNLRGDFARMNEIDYNEFMNRIIQELGTFFRPEWLNRWEDKIPFNMLTTDIMEEIVEYQMEKERNRLYKERIILKYDKKELYDYLLSKGTNVNDGARPLDRLIYHQISGIIAKKLFQAKRGFDWFEVGIEVDGVAPDGVATKKDYRTLNISTQRIEASS